MMVELKRHHCSSLLMNRNDCPEVYIADEADARDAERLARIKELKQDKAELMGMLELAVKNQLIIDKAQALIAKHKEQDDETV
jgi:hypothetical protein